MTFSEFKVLLKFQPKWHFVCTEGNGSHLLSLTLCLSCPSLSWCRIYGFSFVSLHRSSLRDCKSSLIKYCLGKMLEGWGKKSREFCINFTRDFLMELWKQLPSCELCAPSQPTTTLPKPLSSGSQDSPPHLPAPGLCPQLRPCHSLSPVQWPETHGAYIESQLLNYMADKAERNSWVKSIYPAFSKSIQTHVKHNKEKF